MVTARAIRDEIQNTLDYLVSAEIAAYANPVAMSLSAYGDRVTWHSHRPDVPFLVNRDEPTLEDYRNWVEAGAFSALLFEGSLLQLTYDIKQGGVCGHRVAYIPCPYRLDPIMVRTDPLLDLIDLHMQVEPTGMILRSSVRFDFDPDSAHAGHPAAHLTINSSNCRIACTAPMHFLRFIDFVFRHFYPEIWIVHSKFFSEGACREIGNRIIGEEELLRPHVGWNIQSSALRAR
jgi:hypothetical protein